MKLLTVSIVVLLLVVTSHPQSISPRVAVDAPHEQETAGIARGAWTWIGPGNYAGRVRALAIHPTIPGTMFAGSPAGGIWKTTDAGANWTSVSDFLPSLVVSCLVFRPGDSATMFAGTGEGFHGRDARPGAGILRSNDGGATWAQVPSTLTTDFLYVNRLAMSADGNTLLAATSTGLLRSTDLGSTWTKVLTPTALPAPTPGLPDIVDVEFLASSNSAAVASGLSNNAYFSVNGGASWSPTPSTSMFPNTLGSTSRVELAASAASPGTVYALTQEFRSYDTDYGTLLWVLYRSLDGGQTYASQGDTYLGVPGDPADGGALWTDPTNPNIVVVGDSVLSRSTDAGIHWSAPITSGSVQGRTQGIVSEAGFNGTSNTRLYVASDGGVDRADDAYASPVPVFSSLDRRLGVARFYAASGDPASGTIMAGSPDSGTLAYRPGAGIDGWTRIPGTTSTTAGGFTAVDTAHPGVSYGEEPYLRVHRSTDDGASSIDITRPSGGVCNPASPYALGDACNSDSNVLAPLVLDSSHPDRLIAGGKSLWRTDDARTPVTSTTGPTWVAIKPPTAGSNDYVSALAISGDGNVIWVGHNSGEVYVTTDGADPAPFWVRVDTNAPGLPDRAITSIAIDPSNTATAYVTFAGPSGGNVWRTANGGGTWADVSGGGLPTGLIRTVVVHPTNSTWVYVGTDVGMFASADAGAHWSTPGDGPANVQVSQLFFMGTTLVAATFGRGIFTTPVPGSPATTLSLTPASLAFGAVKNGPGGALVSVTPPQTVTVGYTGATPSWIAQADVPWLQINGGAGSGAGTFAVSVVNPGNVIGGSTSLTGVVTVWDPAGASTTLVVKLQVQPTASGGAVPFGQVDTPTQGAGAAGAVGMTGWALDDIGVQGVRVYRQCVVGVDNPAACQAIDGYSLVYVGDAAFLAGVRPSVAAAFPTYPQHARAGWGFQILTNMFPHLPNNQPFGGQGTFQLYAYATDIEGHRTLLGRSWGTDSTPTTITVDNDHIAVPFGTIDTPQLGETVSGLIYNFGWVMTPDLNTIADGTDIRIPPDGSTITAYIDGIAVSVVGYDLCRGTVGSPVPANGYCDDDVSNIFGVIAPQAPLTPRVSNPTRYRNLDAGRAVIGKLAIDTTLLSNGLHTIAWGVSDTAGRSGGIGSRFFYVANPGAGAAPTIVLPRKQK